MTRSSTCAAALLFLSLGACHHAAAPRSPGAPAARAVVSVRYEDRVVARVARSYRVMDWNRDRAVVVGVFDGSRALVTSFGHLRDDTTASPTADTLFEIGSVTKVLTGALLAREVTDGKVRFDEPVQDVLPQLHLHAFAGKQVQLVHLATYSAGYPWMPTNWVPWRNGATYSETEWRTFLESFELTAAPGTHFAYGNVGFGLLGDALAAVERTTYPGALRRRILEPLGMTHSRFLGESLAGESVAPGHDDDGEPVALDHDKPYQAGCCAVWSSANDLLAFLAAHFESTGSARSVPPALRRSLLVALEPRRPGEGSYEDVQVGLGWFVRKDGVATKNGIMGGYRSGIVLDRARRIGVVVLAADSGLDAEQLATDVLEGVVFERDRPAAPQVARLPADAEPRDVRWEPGMQLVGWSAPKVVHPGETVTIAAYYRVTRTVDQSFPVFVDAEEEGAEDLHAKHRPLWPTTDWNELPGLFVDRTTLTLPATQPKGTLTVWTGFAGKKRAAVVGAAGTSKRVKAGTLQVR